MKNFVISCAVFVSLFEDASAMVLSSDIPLGTESIIEIKEDDFFSQLDSAMDNNDKDMVRCLAQKASNFRFKGWNAEQKAKLLFFAVKKDLDEVVEYCADNRFDLDILDSHKKTPLIIATERNNYVIVEYLLISQANPNVYTKFSPLMIAAGRGNERLVRMLICKGADVNAISYLGCTPWSLAIENNHPHIAQMLIDAGASVPSSIEMYYAQKNFENRRRKSELDIAIEMLKDKIEPKSIRNIESSSKNTTRSSIWSFFRSFFRH